MQGCLRSACGDVYKKRIPNKARKEEKTNYVLSNKKDVLYTTLIHL